MKSLEARIKDGLKAIVEARSSGKDTSSWEEHLLSLVDQLVEGTKRVRVRMGRFGFCDCLVSTALCSGCWRVKGACNCELLEVDPQEEINARFAEFRGKLDKPLSGSNRNGFN